LTLAEDWLALAVCNASQFVVTGRKRWALLYSVASVGLHVDVVSVGMRELSNLALLPLNPLLRHVVPHSFALLLPNFLGLLILFSSQLKFVTV
jgi:hypothetical protein